MTRDRITPALPGRDRDQPGQRPGRGQGIQPGVPGVGDQRRRPDPAAGDELVTRHDLVAHDAEDGAHDADAHVRGRAVIQQLADALGAREGGAGPDDGGDPDPGQVLGPVQAVRVALGGPAPGQPEAEEDDRAGRHVAKIVDRVAEQADRAGEHGNQQLSQAGGRQPGGADRDGPVRLAAIFAVVAAHRKREGRGRIALARGLVHPPRMPESAEPPPPRTGGGRERAPTSRPAATGPRPGHTGRRR